VSSPVVIRDPGVQRTSPLWALLISGIVGFLLGALVYPSWQVAVEAAQVVAGLVKYPPGNTFYVYETKLWTILHQICALLLRAGMSEITLSQLLSGVVAMVSLQALAMVAFALCGDVALSVGTAVIVLVTRAASNGVDYPVMLTASSHTYGALGLSMFVLVPALLGAGCVRSGAFLLGLMPAIHPSLGAWLWPIVGLAVLLDLQHLRSDFRRALPWFGVGAAITIVSLLVQLLFIYDGPKVAAEESAPLFRAFITFWDGHRAPVDFGKPGVILNEIALVLAVLWLTGFTQHVPAPSRILLRVVAIAAVGSLGLAVITWLPVDRVPLWLLVLMPARLFNFNAMIFAPLLIGLAAAQRDRLGGFILLIALVAGLLLTDRSMLWEQLVRPQWLGGFTLSGAAILAPAAVAVVLVTLWAWSRPVCPVRAWSAASAPTVRLVYAGVAMLFVILLLLQRPDTGAIFRDRTNDPLYAAVAAESRGVVLTAGGYQLVQLYTRRPVLLYGALDTLPYAPETGPEMQRVLQDIYGVDFYHPPESARGTGTLPRDAHRALWEHNSPERWEQIGRRWDVTQVLTPAGWTLHLPIAAESPAFRLYRIP
jgi:hypothetical protein